MEKLSIFFLELITVSSVGCLALGRDVYSSKVKVKFCQGAYILPSIYPFIYLFILLGRSSRLFSDIFSTKKSPLKFGSYLDPDLAIS